MELQASKPRAHVQSVSALQGRGFAPCHGWALATLPSIVLCSRGPHAWRPQRPSGRLRRLQTCCGLAASSWMISAQYFQFADVCSLHLLSLSPLKDAVNCALGNEGDCADLAKFGGCLVQSVSSKPHLSRHPVLCTMSALQQTLPGAILPEEIIN